MSALRSPTATPSPNTRSAVANQSRLFVEGLDGRSAHARRYRDLIAEFTRDLGGPDSLSEAQRSIIRRAASLCVWCEAVEVQMANGEDCEIGPYTTACNSLRRLLNDIGLERRSKDITPDLSIYITEQEEA